MSCAYSFLHAERKNNGKQVDNSAKLTKTKLQNYYFCQFKIQNAHDIIQT